MAKIFVSYRRQDSPYVAIALKERIERRFGDGSVFFDIDNIPVGVDFRKHIEDAVGQCHAMLVLIGDKWLALVERTGKNRLFDPRDYVRMEIEAALGRRIPVVPVLVEDADMPAAEDLPESIQELMFRNAAELRAGRDFEHHMVRLVDSLASLLEARSTTASTARLPTARKGSLIARKGKPTATKVQPIAEPTLKTKKAVKKAELTLTNLRRAFRDSGNTYSGSSIPPAKLTNALAAYAPQVDMFEVLLLYDDTLFGGAKDGFLLTKTAIHWRNLGEPAQVLEFRDLEEVAKYWNGVIVNGRSIQISQHPACAEALRTLLKEIVKSKS